MLSSRVYAIQYTTTISVYEAVCMIVTKHTFVVAVTVASNHGSSSQPVDFVFRQQLQSISALKIMYTKYSHAQQHKRNKHDAVSILLCQRQHIDVIDVLHIP
jgi:hypothetical protein